VALVPPDAARRRLAFEAGLRPSVRWSLAAASWGILAVALERAPSVVLPALLPQDAAPAVAWALVRRWLTLAGTALVGAVVLGITLALATGIAGPIRSRAGRELGPVRPASAWPVALMAAVVAGTVALALRGVLAGAARGVDASEPALLGLWHTFAVRACGSLGISLACTAVVAAVWERREIQRRLLREAAELRETSQGARR
jgi:hypothetical protein